MGMQSQKNTAHGMQEWRPTTTLSQHQSIVLRSQKLKQCPVANQHKGQGSREGDADQRGVSQRKIRAVLVGAVAWVGLADCTSVPIGGSGAPHLSSSPRDNVHIINLDAGEGAWPTEHASQ